MLQEKHEWALVRRWEALSRTLSLSALTVKVKDLPKVLVDGVITHHLSGKSSRAEVKIFNTPPVDRWSSHCFTTRSQPGRWNLASCGQEFLQDDPKAGGPTDTQGRRHKQSVSYQHLCSSCTSETSTDTGRQLDRQSRSLQFMMFGEWRVGFMISWTPWRPTVKPGDGCTMIWRCFSAHRGIMKDMSEVMHCRILGGNLTLSVKTLWKRWRFQQPAERISWPEPH